MTKISTEELKHLATWDDDAGSIARELLAARKVVERVRQQQDGVPMRPDYISSALIEYDEATK